jgi:hypothetical protein
MGLSHVKTAACNPHTRKKKKHHTGAPNGVGRTESQQAGRMQNPKTEKKRKKKNQPLLSRKKKKKKKYEKTQYPQLWGSPTDPYGHTAHTQIIIFI